MILKDKEEEDSKREMKSQIKFEEIERERERDGGY